MRIPSASASTRSELQERVRGRRRRATARRSRHGRRPRSRARRTTSWRAKSAASSNAPGALSPALSHVAAECPPTAQKRAGPRAGDLERAVAAHRDPADRDPVRVGAEALHRRRDDLVEHVARPVAAAAAVPVGGDAAAGEHDHGRARALRGQRRPKAALAFDSWPSRRGRAGTRAAAGPPRRRAGAPPPAAACGGRSASARRSGAARRRRRRRARGRARPRRRRRRRPRRRRARSASRGSIPASVRRCDARRSGSRSPAGWSPAGIALDAVGLPSSYLFAALLLGLAIALARPDRVALAPLAFRAAQAVAGVSLGAYLQSEALQRGRRLARCRCCSSRAATLGLSLAAGAVLARTTPLDPPTAALGMIAGGASGIVGMSGELGADDRLVAFMQYLRVLVVVLLTPIGIAVLFGGAARRRRRAPPPSAGLLGARWDWAADGRARARRRVRRAAAARHGGRAARPDDPHRRARARRPLEGFAVPDLLGQTAFALIGLQVGLRFTPDDRPAARPPDRPGAARDRRPAGRPLRARRRCSTPRPPRRCSTPTSPPRPAASTRCSRSPSARARTRPSSSPCRACASSRWCCSRRSRCAGCFERGG